MQTDWELIIRAIIAMLMITSAWDPVKVIFFNQVIHDDKLGRLSSAIKIALYTAFVLGGAALIGRQLLNLMGIDLDAFAVVGGLLIVSMGLEMMFGGGASKAQGQGVRDRDPNQQDSLMIPLTLPLIAGPGAITTTITIAAQESAGFDARVVALIGVAAVSLSVLVSFTVLGKAVAKMRPDAAALAARIGGMLLATIGTQMMLGGLKNFFS